ncbi:MAG: hypothetical protein JST55_01930 [Bacteroidetes bacterium]|nr:hypothetical protein [Bacteroidota bacterium]
MGNKFEKKLVYKNKANCKFMELYYIEKKFKTLKNNTAQYFVWFRTPNKYSLLQIIEKDNFSSKMHLSKIGLMQFFMKSIIDEGLRRFKPSSNTNKNTVIKFYGPYELPVTKENKNEIKSNVFNIFMLQNDYFSSEKASNNDEFLKSIAESKEMFPKENADFNESIANLNINKNTSSKKQNLINSKISGEKVIEKIIWNKKPIDLENLFIDLHEEDYVEFYDIETLSRHFKFKVDEPEINSQSISSFEKIIWKDQKTKLMFLMELLIKKGVITIIAEKKHVAISQHFCKKDNLIFNEHTLSQTLNNVQTQLKKLNKSDPNYNKFNKSYEDFIKLIKRHI